MGSTQKRKPYRTFNEWIDEVGAPRVAELLEVSTATVRQWRRGFCYPRVEQMRTIKSMTEGRVDYTLMIEGSKEYVSPRT